MPMTLVVTNNVAPRFRGFLSSVMLEIAPGVYTGPRMSKAVRKQIWTVLEDWYNAVVFHLNGSTLVQRTPVPWDENGSGLVSGLDYIVEPVATNVSRFRVERVAGVAGNYQLVDITLELTSPASGEMVSLHYLDPLNNDEDTFKDAVIVHVAKDGFGVCFIEMTEL